MPEINLNASAKEVAELFIKATMAIHAHGMGRSLSVMNESGLTFTQLMTLHLLRQRGPHSVGEIAGHTKLSKAATSHLVERLVQMGMVRREEHEGDRRKKRVAVSNKGNALLDRINTARTSGLFKAFSSLSGGARKALAKALVQVIKEFDETSKTSVAKKVEDHAD